MEVKSTLRRCVSKKIVLLFLSSKSLPHNSLLYRCGRPVKVDFYDPVIVAEEKLVSRVAVRTGFLPDLICAPRGGITLLICIAEIHRILHLVAVSGFFAHIVEKRQLYPSDSILHAGETEGCLVLLPIDVLIDFIPRQKKGFVSVTFGDIAVNIRVRQVRYRQGALPCSIRMAGKS